MKEMLPIIFILGFLAVFIPKACDYDEVHQAGMPDRNPHRILSPSEFVDRYATPRRASASSALPAGDADPVSPPPDGASPHDLIRRVSVDFDVPAGLLYGIWQKESGGLGSGWGNGGSWYLARDMARPGSICMERYGARCARHWEALQLICDQRRRDGSRVCNPEEVRTSYALAMGPMQHMPAEIAVIAADGSASWGRRAVDYDQDGVVDPHDLDDAMAMSASFLRRYYESKVEELGESGAWRWAANRYFGSQTAGYYDGTDDRRGVAHHWNVWCERYGSCDQARVAFALAR